MSVTVEFTVIDGLEVVTLNTPKKTTLQVVKVLIPNWDNSDKLIAWGISLNGNPPDGGALSLHEDLAVMMINRLKDATEASTFAWGNHITYVQTRAESNRRSKVLARINKDRDEYRQGCARLDTFLKDRNKTDVSAQIFQNIF